MTPRLSLAAASFALLGTLAVPAAAQPPRIVNGRVTTQPAGTLQTTFRGLVAAQAEVGWIGYAVPAVAGNRVMCCADWRGDGSARGGRATAAAPAASSRVSRARPTTVADRAASRRDRPDPARSAAAG